MIKITAISDTHNKQPSLSGGDILIHSGDLTKWGSEEEMINHLKYLGAQKDKYTHILLVMGNHDFFAETNPSEVKELCAKLGLILLTHEAVEVMGLKFWGSPATPTFHNWAYNFDPEPIKELWDSIPSSLDVLITHGPPEGVLDKTFFGINAGCPYLLKKIEEIKPRLHVFGHIHEAAGALQDKDTLFINAATTVCDVEISDGDIKYNFN